AEALVFLSQGVPFIQEGEDFMRSKYNEGTGLYDGNSYISGDFVNAMDYSLKIKYHDTFEKVKELIAVRKATAALRLASRDEIKAKVSDVSFAGGIISYKVDGYVVAHSVNGGKIELDGAYELVYSNIRTDYASGANGEYTLGTNESVLLKKAG
ncbi:MAG: hypothetical protein J6V01_06790, partial [Clostridia bacterium]|nr:hypothetical protein [Clostridia bacterium]